MAENRNYADGQFRKLVDYAPVAIAMFDRDMRYIAASQRWIDDYGLAGRQLEGVSHYEIFPEIPERWREVHRRGLAGEICRAEEDRFERADGRVQWLLWDVRPWFDAEGRIGGILILTEDITARMLAEEAVRFERDKLASVIDAVDVGIVLIRPDGAIELQNAAARRFLADGPNILGSWHEVNAHFEMRDLDGRDIDLGQRPLTRAAAGETVHDCDVTIRDIETGVTRFLRLGAAPIRGAGGQVVLIALSISDLTEIRRSERMLRAGEDRYRAIFEAAPNTIILIDHQGTIQAANPAARSVFGYDVDELIGHNVRILMPPAEAAAHDGYLRRYRETGQAGIIGSGRTVRAQHKSGEIFSVHLTVTEWIDEAGERLFCGTLADLTERRQAERAFAEAQRLEAVALLAGGVAHDFNNSLSVILGNLELAERRDLDPGTRDLVERSLRAAQLAATVTRRLLAFARTPEGAARAISLNDVVGDTLPLLEGLFVGRWSVRLDLGDTLWPVFAHPGEISSAVLNLAANARDAMPGGGAVEITTRNLHLAAAPDCKAGDYVCLSVTDTGEGMPAEVLARAWDPFFSTKKAGTGTGLGLTTVRNLAEQVHGFARIASAVGRGTTVSLYLPRFTPVEESGFAAPSPVLLPFGDGETILVVDDNDQVRETTMRRLEALGYAVREARSGADAVRELERDPGVDLVFTDVVMPGLTGYELARWVRAHLPSVAVVLTSGFPAEAGELAAGEKIVLLHKPCTREQLARIVHQALIDAAGRASAG
jgi:PAS domain S-box-containing protein